MATTLLISCPECDKKIKAPVELKGKKIRCKGCGHTFVVQAGGGGDDDADVLPVQAEPDRKPAKPRRPARPAGDDEDDDPNPYGVTNLKEGHRCPHCAYDMESEDAVICLHCGYNTLTRTHHATKKTIDLTGTDWFLWLLPGILCILAIFVLIVADILYVLLIDALVGEGDWMISWLACGGIKLWIVIVSLFFMFFAARFAVKRLIFNYHPPEKEKH